MFSFVISEHVFSPYLMSPKAMFLMKYMLQHQKWAESYKLELEGLKEEDKELQELINRNLKLIDR